MVKIISGPPWKVAIYFRWPETGRPYRERRFVPRDVTARSGALRWGQGRAADVLAKGEAAETHARMEPPSAPVPTLREFAPRWIEGHAEALRQKRSGIAGKKAVLRRHLIPALGDLRLDQISTERVAKLSAGFTAYSRKTLVNILATLSKLLRTAVDWDILPAMPCKIRVPKAARTPPAFYEQDTMRRLIDAAAATDTRTHALVLLGLHAGLRRSELLGLEWEDISTTRRQLVVRRAVISKFVDTPKSGHGRVIDLSSELTAALGRHLASSPDKTGRVFRQESGRPALAQHLYTWMAVAQERAGIPKQKGCSASRHAPLRLLGSGGARRSDDRDSIACRSPVAADDGQVHAFGLWPSGRGRAPLRPRAWHSPWHGGAVTPWTSGFFMEQRGGQTRTSHKSDATLVACCRVLVQRCSVSSVSPTEPTAFPKKTRTSPNPRRLSSSPLLRVREAEGRQLEHHETVCRLTPSSVSWSVRTVG